MEDVWQHVLSLLSLRELVRSERVCREWRRRAARVEKRWKEVDFREGDFEKAGTSEEGIQEILDRCGTCLHTVRFGQNGEGTSANFPGNIHVTKKHMEIVTSQRRLKRFSAHRMILTLSAMEEFANLPESLEEFSLSHCHMDIYTADAEFIVQKALLKMLGKCGNLKQFKIISRGQWSQHFDLTKKLLLLLPDSLRSLDLTLGEALIIDQVDSLAFLQGKRLDSLVLPRTEILNSHLDQLLQMVDTLETLDLSHSRNVEDFSVIGKLMNLRTLNLSSNELLDHDFVSITAGCPKLKWLSIENCVLLSYQSLAKIGRLYELESLIIGGIPGVEDDVADHVANCVQLEFLDISQCRKLTTTGVSTLLSLPSLNHLCAYGVSSVTNSFLKTCCRVPNKVEKDCEIPSMPISLPPIPLAIQMQYMEPIAQQNQPTRRRGNHFRWWRRF